MKWCLSCILFIGLFSCKTSQLDTRPIKHQNPWQLGHNYADSLLAQGIDSMIVLYTGCSGCSPHFSSSNILFWADGDQYSAIKYDEYATYEKQKLNRFPLHFFDSLTHSVKHGTLNPAEGSFHYTYVDVSYHFSGDTTSFRIKQFMIPINEDSDQVLVLDKLRSCLYDIHWYPSITQSTKNKKSHP